MSDLVAHQREEVVGVVVWELRRDDEVVGTARTRQPYPGKHRLTGLDVPPEASVAALTAVGEALRDQGVGALGVDVPAGHEALSAAVADVDARLAATQMLLELSQPVPAPARVRLRAMTGDEFDGYRDHLVTAYAQDMIDAGLFDDLPAALAASEQSTHELLPDGLHSPGHRLWSGLDADTVVGILWIHVEGPRAFIYDIEVREDQRRKGYGQELLDAGALAAVELGAETLGLNVFAHNDGALALYEKAGYATTERTYRIRL